MSSYIYSIIIIMIEVLCCIIFFDTFLKSRFNNKCLNLAVSCGFLITLTITAILLYNNFYIKSVLVILDIFFFMRIYFTGNFMQIVFCSAAYYGLLITIDKIMFIIMEYTVISKHDYILREPIKVMLLSLIVKAVLFVSVIILNNKFRKEDSFYIIADTQWLRFLFFPSLTIVTILIFVMNKQEQAKYNIVISLGLMAGNFIMFYMISDIVHREKRLQEMLVLKEQTKNKTDMYIQINNNYESQKLKIHEFKHHINCMQGLLEEKQNNAALEYIRNINNSWIEEMNYVLTNHAIVNAVLNEKYKKAKSCHIPMIININNMEYLPVKEEDIVTVLANLLDNAIEAAERIDKGDKYIKFKMLYENKKLIISVRNPVTKEIKTEGSIAGTSKADKEYHGIGMINVDRVVKKYGGQYIFSCKDGYFTSTVVIRN